MNNCFRDRVDAGQRLARRLAVYRGRDDVIVLALPRGGVPVAFEIAARLRLPLDVLVVRKLGAPGHEELAIGAIAVGGAEFFNQELVAELGLSVATVREIIARERLELDRRTRRYRDERPFPDLHDRVVILVDDGIATGATMRVAVEAVRQMGARSIVVAAPVASSEAAHMLRACAEEVIIEWVPESFRAVGAFYGDFDATTDEEVRLLLERAGPRARLTSPDSPVRPSPRSP